MENKKVKIKRESEVGSAVKKEKSGSDTGKLEGNEKFSEYSTLPPELQKQLWLQLNYDLLQVPGEEGEESESLESEETISEPEERLDIEPAPLKRQIELGQAFPQPKRARKTKYTGRSKAENPAPKSKDFEPDWIDGNGVEYSLAIGDRLVDQKKREDKKSIVFWSRAKGKTKDGRDRQFPQIHEKVELTDLASDSIAGYGYVSERYFTRNRVMGVIVLRPLYWNPLAPFYTK